MLKGDSIARVTRIEAMLKENYTAQKILVWIQIALFASVLLYLGKTLFVPMFMGLLIAMVMYPVCLSLETRGLSRSFAITISLSVVILLFVVLISLLIWQLSLFRHDLPSIIEKLSLKLPELQLWLAGNWDIPVEKQQRWADGVLKNINDGSGGFIASSFNATVSTAFSLFIIPIYAALFLYHRHTFVIFLKKIFKDRYNAKLDGILSETTHTYFRYIKGMILVYIIVGILNSIGLLLLGIKHAILFGMLTAIMTIIPYVGIIVSAMLPISIAFLTKDSVFYPLAVIGVFAFVQYLEANVIFPRVVAAQLNVSTWATLVAIIAGGIIWGVAGMVLFIPFVAIFKIVTDNIEEGKSINILLSRKD